MSMKPHEVVDHLLELKSLEEASVHLPARGKKWVAVYTGPEPGKQIWRSTGLTDRKAALRLAQKWEAEARMERLKARAQPRALQHRVSRAKMDAAATGLTQREVALILGLSERAVRNIEKRALAKLRGHPAVQELLDEYFGPPNRSGQIEEGQPYTGWDWPCLLSQEEIAAVFRLARSAEERRCLWRLLHRLSAR